MAATVVFCRELFFSTRIVATAKGLGRDVLLAADLDAVPADRDVRQVVVDLDHPLADEAGVARLRLAFPPPIQIVAFGPHVDADRLRAARRAGADLVLPRSEFSRRLPELLSNDVAGGRSSTSPT